MADRCPTIRGLCRIRLTRLTELGHVAPDANNSWVSEGMISLAVAPEIEAGTENTLKNGCGKQLASSSDNDIRKRFNLTLVTGKDEPGMREMLLGDDLILDGTDVIGTSAADQTDEDFVPAAVALEAWLKLWDSDAQDAVKPWLYLLWPATYSWVPQDVTAGEDFLQPGFVGKSRSNQLWGDGPYDDLGITPGQLGPIFNWVQVEEDPPDSACGFAHVSPGS